ncbi:MAG: 50S ribosomal protein L4 [Flavobacteriaceae bacterium]|nr:50S ribosomal protein L4 [Flavobacteriaceae bacterium]MCY4253306.1 50S ribosomal protein L4 [Flavobacteriaceae bacterium]
MTLKVLTQEGKETQNTVRLNKSVFGIEPNQHAIYLDVKAILANKRSGTHQTKERGEIVGSTRKLRRQKGTGAARVGSIKNPIFRKGGRTFGPKPRSYEQKVNKQLKKLARKSALSQKVKNKELKVVDKFELKQPKTKELTQSLHDLGIDQTKTLVVLSQQNKNVYLASRNLQKAKVVVNTELNTYDISDAKCIVIEQQAIKQIESALKS